MQPYIRFCRSAQTICYNTAPAALTQLTAPTGGPGAYTYQWQSSPDNSTWTSIGGATELGYTSTCTDGKHILQATGYKRHMRNSKQRIGTDNGLC